jgi:AbrB family looped-hinge helix DNA binding protein
LRNSKKRLKQRKTNSTNIAVILITYYFISPSRDMPRITTKGQVTIPKEIREPLGIEPGDEIAFEEVSSGYKIQKKEPTTADGNDPFAKYRGSAESDETMPERMRRLRREYPRDVGDDCDDESEAEA